jgi:hypothetical protein
MTACGGFSVSERKRVEVRLSMRERVALPPKRDIRGLRLAQGQGTVVTAEVPPSLLRHLRSEGFPPTVASM